MLRKSFYFFFVILFGAKCFAQNIALHKSYVLSSDPNYQYTALPNNKTALTDGVFTDGNFWTKRTTVGWQYRQVTITIDLKDVLGIKSIAFNTVEDRKRNAYFPRAIFIFLSSDDIRYTYAGNLIYDPDNMSGQYEVKRFVKDDVNCKGRFVKIVVVPNGQFVFCDEIQVFKDSRAEIYSNRIGILKEHLEYVVDSLLEPLSITSQCIDRMVASSDRIEGWNVDSIQNAYSKLKNGKIRNTGKEYMDYIGQEYALELSKRFSRSFVVEKYSPWDTLNELHLPKSNLDSLNYNFLVPVGNVRYGAFVITNISPYSQEFSFKIENENHFNSLELYDVPFVSVGQNEYTPDPLVPIKRKIAIGAGFCEMVLFKLSGLYKGMNTAKISIQSGDERLVLNISSDVIDDIDCDGCALNADNWAYLNYPMLRDRSLIAAADLHAHYINTIIVPPAVIPRIGASNFQSFKKYISSFKNKNVDNILVSQDFTSPSNKNDINGFAFMSVGWKQNFVTWYHYLTNAIRSAGFSNINLYLCPYDEIREKDFNDFEKLIAWARISVSGIQFFATLTNKSNVNSILPLVDIAQIRADYLGFANLPLHTAKIWVYEVNGRARTLSPYRRYRLLALSAFLSGYTGVGFWNYADIHSGMDLNLVTKAPDVNPYENYSVIYDGPASTIISSRRWEAFREGMEDYKVLCVFAKKYHIDRAKTLAKLVLNNPCDYNKADSVVKLMLNSIVYH